MNSKKKIVAKAALFDLDGTLLDTESMYAAAFQKIVTEHGNGALYDWPVRQYVMGVSRMDGARTVINGYNLKITPEELLEQRDSYLTEWFPNSKPMPGAMDLTYTLKHKLGLKIAVATSSRRGLYDIKMSKHKAWAERDFHATVTGDDPRIKAGKPSPDIFCIAASDCGVLPSECIIFEDAVNGVKAGLAAGAALVVGVPDPHIRPKMEVFLNEPNFIIINSFAEFDTSMIAQNN